MFYRACWEERDILAPREQRVTRYRGKASLTVQIGAWGRGKVSLLTEKSIKSSKASKYYRSDVREVGLERHRSQNWSEDKRYVPREEDE